MSARAETLQLRLELLKVRAELERAELRAALAEVRRATAGARRAASIASRIGEAVVAGGGGLAPLLGTVAGHPWLVAFALRALRLLRRHPLAGAALAAAVVAAIIRRRMSARGTTPAQPAPGERMPPENA
jgi:hypothetical protein